MTESDNSAALTRIRQLWDTRPNTPAGNEFDALVTLVQEFEAANYPIDTSNSIEAIKFRMEQAGFELSQSK